MDGNPLRQWFVLTVPIQNLREENVWMFGLFLQNWSLRLHMHSIAGMPVCRRECLQMWSSGGIFALGSSSGQVSW